MHRPGLARVDLRRVSVGEVLVELEHKNKEKHDPAHVEERGSSTNETTVATSVANVTVLREITRSRNRKRESDEVKNEDEEESNPTLHEQKTNGRPTSEDDSNGGGGNAKVHRSVSPSERSKLGTETQGNDEEDEKRDTRVKVDGSRSGHHCKKLMRWSRGSSRVL